MKLRLKKFRPPTPSDPPRVVEVTWVDAVHSNGEAALSSIGGLKRLPCAGYHVRTEMKGPHGPFVVIALEHDRDEEGTPTGRFHLTIPVAWIVGWSEAASWNICYPIPGEEVL